MTTNTTNYPEWQLTNETPAITEDDRHACEAAAFGAITEDAAYAAVDAKLAELGYGDRRGNHNVDYVLIQVAGETADAKGGAV